jgi:hypothetical protein
VAVTALPVELRAVEPWRGGWSVADVVGNLLLFAPLGGLLARRSLWLALGIALALSALIEIAQLWSAARFPSPLDVAANTVGAALGWWFVQRRGKAARLRQIAQVDGRLTLVAVCVAVGLLLNWTTPIRSSTLADWAAVYPLQLGNEATGDRPWRGTMSSLALFARSLLREEIRAGSTALADRSDAIVVLPHLVRMNGGRSVLLPAEAAEEFARQAMATDAFSVLAQITTERAEQTGPARIVSFSTDPYHRNFDLGQDGTRLAFRVRTPLSGANGERQRLTSAPVLKAAEPVWIAATYDGRIARIYADGDLVGRLDLGAAACRIPTLCDASLATGWAAIAGVFTLVALLLVQPRTRPAVVVAALVAGLAATALPWLLDLEPVLTADQPAATLGPLLGAGAVAAARLAALRAEGVRDPSAR